MSGRSEHSVKHTLSSQPADHGGNSVTTMRRIDLSTGSGLRRRRPGCATAGRGWLEPSRCAPTTNGRVNGSPEPEPAFAPVVLASAPSSPTAAAPLSPAIDTAMRGLIEIAIADLTVRIRGQIETGLL